MPEKSAQLKLFFTQKLMEWNQKFNKREMPWKKEKDPYKIWISEIILQQTRVEQGLDYYNRFIDQFPDVKKLAQAKEFSVFKLWEGLGYYSRCKNLISTAKFINEELNGVFPNAYEKILALKGVGPYTAAAIASFAYNLPYAVVDGNVTRVLSRFFSINIAVDTTEGKKIFNELAQSLLKKDQANIYNQAIMDFGATICKPRSPICTNCLLANNCQSFLDNTMNSFPVKSKHTSQKERWLYYLVAEYNDRFYIRKRAQKDIWQNLHEFLVIEMNSPKTTEEVLKSKQFKERIASGYNIISVSKPYQQKLTHQLINGVFIHLKLKDPVVFEDFVLKSKSQIKRIAFPRIIFGYVTENNFLS